MTREELETAIRGLIGPRYWVMDELMGYVDTYTGVEHIEDNTGEDDFAAW